MLATNHIPSNKLFGNNSLCHYYSISISHLKFLSCGGSASPISQCGHLLLTLLGEKLRLTADLNSSSSVSEDGESYR